MNFKANAKQDEGGGSSSFRLTFVTNDEENSIKKNKKKKPVGGFTNYIIGRGLMKRRRGSNTNPGART